MLYISSEGKFENARNEPTSRIIKSKEKSHNLYFSGLLKLLDPGVTTPRPVKKTWKDAMSSSKNAFHSSKETFTLYCFPLSKQLKYCYEGKYQRDYVLAPMDLLKSLLKEIPLLL